MICYSLKRFLFIISSKVAGLFCQIFLFTTWIILRGIYAFIIRVVFKHPLIVYLHQAHCIHFMPQLKCTQGTQVVLKKDVFQLIKTDGYNIIVINTDLLPPHLI